MRHDSRYSNHHSLNKVDLGDGVYRAKHCLILIASHFWCSPILFRWPIATLKLKVWNVNWNVKAGRNVTPAPTMQRRIFGTRDS